MANEALAPVAAKASAPMSEAKPGELVTLVNVKTGERVRLFPVDAAEYRDPKRHADAANWYPEGHRLDPGAGGAVEVAAQGDKVQTVRDLSPDPPPLPGEPKAGKGAK